MSVPLFAHALRSYFLFAIVGFTLIWDKGERDRKLASELDEVLYVWHDLCVNIPVYTCTALATSCQVYPLEYAYKDDSVTRTESNSANCRRYQNGLQEGVFTDQYIHCDGTQLKLTDSDLGQEQFQTADYYVWSSGSGEQLLFIFPTRVSLTTITLHYYSDSVTGLPRLSFYAVPDDFDAWDAPSTRYPHVDVASVPPGGGPAGRRNVNITVNFNTQKVLMYKLSSNFVLAVSEVEFFSTCSK